MTKETKLLPCPFCGGKAELIKPTDTERWAQVNCTACGCRGTEYPAEITKAIAAWNRRALSPPEPTEEQVEAAALAICKTEGEDFELCSLETMRKCACLLRARAALRAMPLQEETSK